MTTQTLNMNSTQHSLIEITKLAKKVATELLRYDKLNTESIALINAITAFAYQEKCSKEVHKIIFQDN